MSNGDKEKLKKYKHMMFLTKPLRGYLGSQYNYWEAKYRNLKSKSLP